MFKTIMRRNINKLFLFILLSALYQCHGKSVEETSAAITGTRPSGKHHGPHKHLIYQRHFKEEDWVNSLIWNLIGYSTVLVPAFAIYRMAKYSNFNERNGKLNILSFNPLWMDSILIDNIARMTQGFN